MIYIISGSDIYLIDQKLKEIVRENKGFDIVKVDAYAKDFSYYGVLDSIISVGLFASSSIVLVKDPLILKRKVENNPSVDELIEYCKKPIYENILVFYTYDNNFNKNLKAYKDISKNADVLDLKVDPKNFYSLCIDLAKKYSFKLDNNCFNLVYKSCNNSLTLFKQNMDILELYPDKINQDVIESLIISSNEENVFNLINSLTNKKVSDSIYYAKRILSNDSNINGLMALLASQLRFLYEVSFWSKTDSNPNYIADKMNVKSVYRIQKALESLRHLKGNEIMALLDKLANLDYKSKVNSDYDDTLKLELFIVDMIK